jgi:hypothetical protein
MFDGLEDSVANGWCGGQAACLGCVGFAAFSAAMEAIMGNH